MEETKLGNQNDDEEDFFSVSDTGEEFPFFDCGDTFSELADSLGGVSSSASVITLNSSGANLRRRRQASPAVSEVVKFESLPASNVVKGAFEDFVQTSESPEDNQLYLSLKCKNSQNEAVGEGLVEDVEETPVVTDPNHERKRDSVENSAILGANLRGNCDHVEDNTHFGETHDANTSFLLVLAGLVIRAIGLQFSVLVYLFMSPWWLMSSSYMIVVDPFRAVRRCRKCLISRVMRIWEHAHGKASALINNFLEEHGSFFKWGLKLGWGFFCAVYVGVVLVCLLVAAFVVGGMLVKVLVEKPIKMTENLDFDYTKTSPVAFVPVAEFPGAKCGLSYHGNAVGAKLGRVDGLPPDHKLQVTVLLTLPESDYNRNLGIFQVRVDFLGVDGSVLASLRRPCMLHFNSQPIRLLLTIIKMVPLLIGYSSESQDLNIKFRAFSHGGEPITCLRLMIEPRAQLQPRDGIPEIYSAYLLLESEQPFLKRILWYWKSTVFIWVSMTVFTMELLIALICCKSVILPRLDLKLGSAANDSQ